MPNREYLDKSTKWKIKNGKISFDEPAYVDIAEAIIDSGLATRVGKLLGSGKEADVYLCVDGNELISVKVYRQYRTSHRDHSTIKLDTMSNIAVREFELLNYAYQGGASVPEPFKRFENMFSMQYLGTEMSPAPSLQRIELRDPDNFMNLTLNGIEQLAVAGIIHTDLSPFNILVLDDKPWFIDLADAIRADRLGIPPWLRLEEARSALIKGLSSLQKYFDRYRISFDSRGVQNSIIEKIDKFGNA